MAANNIFRQHLPFQGNRVDESMLLCVLPMLYTQEELNQGQLTPDPTLLG